MPETNDKYIVFKRDEFEQQNPLQFHPNLHEVEDAVVIRRQDIFAGPAFHAYAACISIVAKGPYGGHPYPRLVPIADYFHEQAVLADEVAAAGDAKIPD